MKKFFKISMLLLAILFATFIFTACITGGGDYNNGNGNGYNNGDNGYDNGYNGEDGNNDDNDNAITSEQVEQARQALQAQQNDFTRILQGFYSTANTRGSLTHAVNAVSNVAPNPLSLPELWRQAQSAHVPSNADTSTINTFAVDLFMYSGVLSHLLDTHDYNAFNYNFNLAFTQSEQFALIFTPPTGHQQFVPYSVRLIGSIGETNSIYFVMRAQSDGELYNHSQAHIKLTFNSQTDFNLTIVTHLYDAQNNLMATRLNQVSSASRAWLEVMVSEYLQTVIFASINAASFIPHQNPQFAQTQVNYVINTNTQMINTINTLQQENLRHFRLINDGILTAENQQLTTPTYVHTQQIILDFNILNTLRA